MTRMCAVISIILDKTVPANKKFIRASLTIFLCIIYGYNTMQTKNATIDIIPEIRYNRRKRKTSGCEADICFSCAINEQMPCGSRAESALARICEFREAHICRACTGHMRFLLYDSAKQRTRCTAADSAIARIYGRTKNQWDFYQSVKKI